MEKNKNTKDPRGEYLLEGTGISLSDLKLYWDMAETEYAPVRKRMYLLDAADRGQLWKTILKDITPYNVFAESNKINYTKENLLSSIYSVGQSANFIPRRESEKPITTKLNSIKDIIWHQVEAKDFQRQAGERAALLNIGITQVGWKHDTVGGTNEFLYKGDVTFKNINPQQFMRDPYAANDDASQFMVTWEDYHINKLRMTAAYKERMKELIEAYGPNLQTTDERLSNEPATDRAKDRKSENKYHRVQMYWVRTETGNIVEIHVINNEFVLYVKKDFFLKHFPFAILYCNEPGGDLIGASEPAKIFTNYIAYNLLLTIVATHAYKSDNPPRFLNTASGINVRQFAKHGGSPGKLWLVNTDAREAVHYGKFPDLPPMIGDLINRFGGDMKDTSGIDDMYAGKNFGSVTTTGGTENLIDRTTGRDVVKIQLYEKYTKRLTMLAFEFYRKYGGERLYAVPSVTNKNNVKDTKIDFNKEIASASLFDYECNITPDLPKTKARLAQAANMLMEKQMQYGGNPELMTVEEWLLFQDIPFKDLISERVKIQRGANTTEEVTQVLFQFAGLIEEGMDPNEALEFVVQSMEQQKNPEEQTLLGNTGNAATFQDRQQG